MMNKYKTILADPPWQENKPLLSITEINKGKENERNGINEASDSQMG